MSFTLRVEFSGLCAYLKHPETKQVAILMPDCRKNMEDIDPIHDDGEVGVPHVGYIRIDLASLGVGVPPGDDADGPRYEVVHRFDRQQMDFVFPDEQGEVVGMPGVPDSGEFAPELEVRPEMFSRTPPPALLMRTLLDGGTLAGRGENRNWKFSTVLNPGQPEHTGRFNSFVVWTREVAGDALTLRITDFDDGQPHTLLLRPVDAGNGKRVVSLKVANLCAENPLEWEGFRLRLVAGDDKDFKWLYRLFRGPNGQELRATLGENLLPIPQLNDTNPSGAQDCLGKQQTTAFPAMELSIK